MESPSIIIVDFVNILMQGSEKLLGTNSA